MNFPTAESFHKCMRTIQHNGWDEDEIAAAGLTAEPSRLVNAPRIAECPLSLECRCLWERELEPGDRNVVLCLKVVNVAMDPALLSLLYTVAGLPGDGRAKTGNAVGSHRAGEL